jgi:hypothetical protein
LGRLFVASYEFGNTGRYREISNFFTGNFEKATEIIAESGSQCKQDADRLTQQSKEKLANRRARAKSERTAKCAECEIDENKTTFLRTEQGWVFTEEKPGKIVMKNGDEYKFYKDKKGRWYIPDVAFNETTFDSFEKMIKYFENKCQSKYCY